MLHYLEYNNFFDNKCTSYRYNKIKIDTIYSEMEVNKTNSKQEDNTQNTSQKSLSMIYRDRKIFFVKISFSDKKNTCWNISQYHVFLRLKWLLHTKNFIEYEENSVFQQSIGRFPKTLFP